MSTNSFARSLPSLSQRIEQEQATYLNDKVRLSIPAIVLGVDDYPAHQCVDVQPLIGVTNEDGSQSDAPKLKKIFVKLPDAGTFRQTYPVKVGNLVTLHWCHKSLNEFLDGGGIRVYPDEEDRWDMRDCYATVGFGSRKVNQSPDPDNYTFSTDNGSYQLVITPSAIVTEKAESITRNCNKHSTNASNIEENSQSHTIDTQSLQVTSTANNITGPLDVTETITAPILQAILQGPNGGPATSDTTFTATELHAGNGYNGQIIATNGTFTVRDGIIIG